jgi:hypothetical protein
MPPFDSLRRAKVLRIPFWERSPVSKSGTLPHRGNGASTEAHDLITRAFGHTGCSRDRSDYFYLEVNE